MNRIALFLAFALFLISCERKIELIDPPTFKTGTYYGEKTIQNFSTNNFARDTITIKFDSVKYLYSGSWELDYGKGNYFISNDSIEFNDELFRNAMHSWNWILSGKYKFRLIDDSLILSQRYYNQLITYRLTKIAEQ